MSDASCVIGEDDAQLYETIWTGKEDGSMIGLG